MFLIGIVVVHPFVSETHATTPTKLLSGSEEVSDSSQVMELMNKARLDLGSGQTHEAISSLERALRMAKQQNKIELIGAIYSSLGDIQYQMKNLKQALYFYNLALQGLSPKNVSGQQVKFYERIGDSYFKLSLFKKALSFYKLAFELNQVMHNEVGQILDLANLAAAYLNLGEYSLALALYHNSLRLADTLHDKKAQMRRLMDIGTIYFHFGDYNRALSNYERALDFAKSVSDQKSIAQNLLNIGRLYSTVGDSVEATRHFTQAYDTFHQIADINGEVKAYRYMGDLLINYGMYQKAIRFYERALSILEQSRDKQEWGFCMIGMGNGYLKLQNWKEASFYFRKALADSVLNQTIQWKAHFGLGQIFESQKRYEEAFSQYKKTIDTIESALLKIHSEAQRAGFFEDKVQIYETYVNLLNHLLEDKRPGSEFYAEEAFHIVERSRARSFLESLDDSRIFNRIIDTIADSLFELQQIYIDREYCLTQKMCELAFNKGSIDTTELSRLRQERIECKKKIKAIQIEIHAQIHKIVHKETIAPIVLEDLRKVLRQENRFLLEYMLGRERSFVWGIDGDNLYIAQLPLAPYIQEQVEILLGGISSPDRKISTLITKPGRKLFDMLIGPVASKIKKNQKLVIIPDGILNYLPFELLIPPAEDGIDRDVEFELEQMPPFLFERNSISYAPSATIFAYIVKNRSRRYHTQDLLAMADPEFDRNLDLQQLINSNLMSTARSSKYSPIMTPWKTAPPLPFSKEEVRRIGKIFRPGKVMILLGPRATEKRLKSCPNLTDYRCLHFATHGIINETHPEFSGLLFSRNYDAHEDGFLRLPEIFELKIKPDLVVLSACRSAQGKIRRGDGLQNMARAFIYAGAPSVVASLWNVDDRSTAEFMEIFYHFLIEAQQAKDVALKNAKLEMIKKNQYAHPYYWALFILIGDPGGRYVRRE